MLLHLSCSSPEERKRREEEEGRGGGEGRRGGEQGRERRKREGRKRKANYDLHTWQTVPSLPPSPSDYTADIPPHTLPPPLSLHIPLPFPPPLTSNALNMFADTPLATSYSPCSLGFRSIIEQNILGGKQHNTRS